MQARIKKFSLFAFLDFIWYFKEALQFSKVQLVASATTIWAILLQKSGLIRNKPVVSRRTNSGNVRKAQNTRVRSLRYF